MVIAVCGHYLSSVPEVLIRVSCPFGGGVGGTRQELCGALSGGIMALGALFGRTLGQENDEQVNRMAARLRALFLERYGSTVCQPIRDVARDEQVHCLPVVEQGVRFVIGLIEETRQQKVTSSEVTP